MFMLHEKHCESGEQLVLQQSSCARPNLETYKQPTIAEDNRKPAAKKKALAESYKLPAKRVKTQVCLQVDIDKKIWAKII